jgi:hypothetical protein
MIPGVPAFHELIPKFHCTVVEVVSGSDKGRRGVLEKEVAFKNLSNPDRDRTCEVSLS